MQVGKEDHGPGGCEGNDPFTMILDSLVWLGTASAVNNEFDVTKCCVWQLLESIE